MKYIMLSYAYQRSYTLWRVATLLIVFSVLFSHSPVFAEKSQETAEYYRELGYAKHQSGDLSAALAHYTKAISLGFTQPVVFNDLGILYEQIGLNGKAEVHYLKALTTDRTYLPTYGNLADFYDRTGRKKEAVPYYLYRAEHGDPDDPWTERARAKLIELEPRYKQVFLQKKIDELESRVVQEAQREFNERVAQAYELFESGKSLFHKGRFDEAIRQFDRALKLTPDNPKFLNAKEAAKLELSKRMIKEHSDQAIRWLESGNTGSAKGEIQKMLSTIPNK